MAVVKRDSCNGFWCYKYLTLTYGLLFVTIGLLLLGMGLWVTKMKASFEAVSDLLGVPALLALIVGICMVTVGVLGIVGALREHVCLLRFFLAVVVIVFILQIVIGVVAFVYREETVKVSFNQLKFAVEGYFEDEDLMSAVDYIQSNLECCGLNSPSDWDFNGNFSCANRDSSLSCSLPLSCCMEPAADCLGGDSVRRRITSSRLNGHGINTTGCNWEFLRWVEDHLDALGATAMGFAILHILGIFVVYMFIGKVEDYSKLYKYRKRVYETE